MASSFITSGAIITLNKSSLINAYVAFNKIKSDFIK